MSKEKQSKLEREYDEINNAKKSLEEVENEIVQVLTHLLRIIR